MANSVDPDQPASIFASMLNSAVMLGNYLQQQMPFSNVFFSWCFKG